MLFFILLIWIITFLYIWQRLQKGRNINEPPSYPGALPLIGHAHKFLGNSKQLWRVLNELADYNIKTEGTTTLSTGLFKFCLTTDPDDCLTIANTCLQKNTIYNFFKPWLGEGLFTATESIWKKDRKFLSPSFNQQILGEFMDVFNIQSRLLVKEMEEEVGKGPFDHNIYLLRNSLQTIYLTATGIPLRSDNELDIQYMETVEKILHSIVERFQKFWLHIDFFWQRSSQKVTQDNYIKIVHAFSDTIIKKRKTERRCGLTSHNNNGKRITNFLDLLLNLEAAEDTDFTEQTVREHMDTIIVAGFDTNATILTFTLVLIGSYPEVQDRLYNELQKILGTEDIDVKKQDLSRLVYLEAVIKESMRLYPIGPIIGRYVDRELRLKKYTLSPGTSCFLMTNGVHRHPMWGADAQEFNPERWLDPAKLPKHRNVYFPFSLGRRMCIGQAYAMMAMKTTLVHFLRHYRVTGDHLKMVLKMECMLKPDSGHHVAIERRN